MTSIDRTPWITSAVLVAICLVGACSSGDAASDVDEGDALALTTGALRTIRKHGALSFPSWTPTQIDRAHRVHVWDFELSAAASVSIRTEASHEGDVDTLMSLYREGLRGEGRVIARNDDSVDSALAALSVSLQAGRYRVVIRAGGAKTSGTFILAAECRGAGCPRPIPDCLFGPSFYELLHGEPRDVEIVSEEQVTSVAQLTDPTARAQLLAAVQQSSHTDVTTPEEALSRVDQQTVRLLELRDAARGEAYTAYEYGAGDNSYGAVFSAGTLEIAASIHDGEFLNCTPQPAQ